MKKGEAIKKMATFSSSDRPSYTYRHQTQVKWKEKRIGEANMPAEKKGNGETARTMICNDGSMPQLYNQRRWSEVW
jgi:hypothetical protein